ncbi:MAG: hypothetical protein H6604_06180 [Flavobacteriales bacterium]|nr:hypothetical protein [Flavobacteriales bacterium]
MANLFNSDFIDFLRLLNKHRADYVLVGGYAVILHGYVRSTADMDIWVSKTSENYQKLQHVYTDFGVPIFPSSEFLNSEYDVWSIGREPNKIDIINHIKGLNFDETINLCEFYDIEDFKIPYIHLNHLIQAKKASGRFKDLADIEQLLLKRNK